MGTSFCTVCAGTNFWGEMLEFRLTQYARNLYQVKGLFFVFLKLFYEGDGEEGYANLGSHCGALRLQH